MEPPKPPAIPPSEICPPNPEFALLILSVCAPKLTTPFPESDLIFAAALLMPATGIPKLPPANGDTNNTGSNCVSVKLKSPKPTL